MINSKNLIIRQLELGDEEYLYKWWNDGDMMEHATHVFGTLQSKESIKKSILKDIEDTKMFPNSKRFIICKKDTLVPIGEINYSNWDSRNQKAELGIKICNIEEQGKGNGVDALYHFIDFMFKFLNINKIELTTMSDNKRAQQLYRKLGFKEIGIIREAYFDSRYGKFADVMYMDLLKKDWDNLKSDILKFESIEEFI
ncbi:GNAT family N-acetyltransferase [Romboutsia sp. 1001216sp1]|uniref:GNAT family N-acetyltransferase n=1 Tax=Romboutsia sp. 1001216sp1 TaxID=2986997 RepID=UPI00232FCECC|nr:GNAT family protein [Romboutsia sp. 1001216sp1]MDB8803702.1 GNAT family protein [Romboutsia sp. 1001216sp1]MDB8807796.1 GNAT family protein [Romboutsia sp. 1001216sp1]MDB8809349.1 GNAT family protein [Romboutsia sp. 1001216sp1]MDB8815098.1 GNAT family protein [Romboutsia sp. 1001216sp1]MDB8817791.1 GNAT family protein [Romboutsia sp. 1001216sp1]